MAGNTVVALLAIVLGGTVFAIAGLLAVNRWLPQIRRQDDEGPVFRLSSVALDIVAVGSIAALTGFVLFLIYALQHPFAGDVKISPEPFLQVARQFAAGG